MYVASVLCMVACCMVVGCVLMAALNCTALHCKALHCAALHDMAQHGTARHSTPLQFTALRCAALHCKPRHCTALHGVLHVDQSAAATVAVAHATGCAAVVPTESQQAHVWMCERGLVALPWVAIHCSNSSFSPSAHGQPATGGGCGKNAYLVSSASSACCHLWRLLRGRLSRLACPPTRYPPS